MKRFQNNIINQDVSFAITVAETMLMPESLMMQELRDKNDFGFNSGSGMEVYNRIIQCKQVAPIFTYKSKWPWSAALGYSDGASVYLNLRKLGKLSLHEIVGLLLHEWLHIGPGFTHGNNFPSELKSRTSVNYYVSDNVLKWI